MNDTGFKKPLYKNEVARLMGQSINTLRLQLNSKYFERLQAETNYTKTQKMLNVKQLRWLEDEIGLTNDEL